MLLSWVYFLKITQNNVKFFNFSKQKAKINLISDKSGLKQIISQDLYIFYSQKINNYLNNNKNVILYSKW